MPQNPDALRDLVRLAILDAVSRAQWKGPTTKVSLFVSPDVVKFVPVIPPAVEFFGTDKSLGPLGIKAVSS